MNLDAVPQFSCAAGVSSGPVVEAIAPKVLWAIDFQFDSTIDGKVIKIASMIDEHTRSRCCTWWNGRSPPSGSSSNSSRYSPRPAVRRRCCGWTTVRSWFRKHCNSFARQCRVVLHSAWYAVEQRLHRIVQQSPTKECLNRNHWTTLLEARVVIGDFKHEHNRRHRHSALGYLTPAEYAAACRHTHHPVACAIN